MNRKVFVSTFKLAQFWLAKLKIFYQRFPLTIREIRKQRVTKEGIPFLSLAMKIMWLYRTNWREACFNMAVARTQVNAGESFELSSCS